MTVAVADDYERFVAGVRRLGGLDLSQYKRGQMERRVRSLARGRGGLDGYLTRLRQTPSGVDELLGRLTINVSELWRTPDMWRSLAGSVLPELAAAGRIRAWSAGCSYGAEAFTLLAECADRGFAVHVRGTDLDPEMVTRARAGRFTAADAREAPPATLARHFVAEHDGWRAGDGLRRCAHFEQADLLRLSVRSERYDLVLCRNTVIYFTPEVRDALHARLAAALRPGGYLVVGGTERVADARALGLTTALPGVYRREPA